MAKVVKEMPKKAGGIGREPKYPYAEWLDGQIWELESGDTNNGADFEGKPQSMRANINNAARKMGLKVESRISQDGKLLTVRSKPAENGKVK